MPYVPPAFNLSLLWWNTTHIPNVDPADATVDGQLYFNSKPFADIVRADPTQWEPCNTIRIPISFFSAVARPYIQTFFGVPGPGGTLWYYRVRFWDFVHRGFSNEYLLFVVDQCTGAGAIPDSSR